MTILLVLLIIGAVGAVAFALIRGLHAFANLRPAELDETGLPKSLAVQNKMMFARVKWQFIAVALLAVLVIVAGSQ
ncbi:MAG: HIG1 domain-containing protein [Sphingomonadaceae bacterium]|jgi:hypothetical protein|nr:HIG1 domain-containing protein [Sphingomonadaceae bacterium]MBJ7389611.1 HIG1 domain-containing protein [Sphingomonadaceae bacterium]MBJ7526456.1 HIG1 domain-containing protein [Sphingomonadaceae bacterium]